MELKKGMYVRYTRGAINGYVPPRIARLKKQIVNGSDIWVLDNNQEILESDIIKASYNIIKLIQKDDYVNGKKVEYVIEPDVCGDEELDYGKVCIGRLNYIEYEDIKSIVTKECFESMSYKVGDK